MNSHSNTPSAPFITKIFEARMKLPELVRALELSFDNCRLAPRVRLDKGASEVRFELDDISIVASVLGSFHVSIVVTAENNNVKMLGLVVSALTAVKGVRALKLPKNKSPGRPRVSRPEVSGFAIELARLGIKTRLPVNSLEEFLQVLTAHPVVCLKVIIPPKIFNQAAACTFRNPVLLARRVVDVVLRARKASFGQGYYNCFCSIGGFSPNLSETQLTQFRDEYTVIYNGTEYVGRLHITVGSGFSPHRCASFHWAFDNGVLVITRIGSHGRSARS